MPLCLLLGFFVFLKATPAQGNEIALARLPSYEVRMVCDIPSHSVEVIQKATWTNHSSLPVHKVQMNTHARFIVPASDVAVMAKTLEILRMTPSDSLGSNRSALEMQKVFLFDAKGNQKPTPYEFTGQTKTTLEVQLSSPLQPGEKIALELHYRMVLPEKQGRWGYWRDVHFLVNWLPVFAYHDQNWGQHPQDSKQGWKPTPFIPWHQPFHNEAGNYKTWITLPEEMQVASSGHLKSETKLQGGMKTLCLEATGVRDFAVIFSKRYKAHETTIQIPGRKTPLKVRVMAFAEHEFYAKKILGIVTECMTVYSQWFGPYPYEEFTIAESYFGWNGNECGSLVMIDDRIFSMPEFAHKYAEYLISHEVCHQWWYNLVGTDGYRETWMDEALATHFSHRFLNQTRGKNNELLDYPAPLRWLPNIKREDYRMSGFYSALGRGDHTSILKPMEEFGHVVKLFSMCYDKGAKVVEMIEARLGEKAFLDFMKEVRMKYEYKVLHVADFQKALEEYTQRSWEDFFEKWLRGTGLSDWKIESVKVEGDPLAREILPFSLTSSRKNKHTTKHLVVTIKQNADYSEPTYLGFAFDDPESFPVRIPIFPSGGNYQIDNPPASVENLGGELIRIRVELQETPSQIAIDPDLVIPDSEPSNNYWQQKPRFRFTPLYTFIDETSLTNSYDRWNFIFGPWAFFNSYDDVWYTRSSMFGARMGAYKSQHFSGGLYGAYRTDFRDFIVGADGLISHWPDSPFQFGYNAEQRLYTFYEGNNQATRASVFGRYVFLENPSMYMLPSHFVDVFGSFRDNFLPDPIQTVPGAQRFQNITTGGVHYRINYQTPYWDPEGGFQFDATYEAGTALLNQREPMQRVWTEASTVKYLPDLSGLVGKIPGEHPWLNRMAYWAADTRLAVRAFGGTSVPSYGQFFTMGGGEMFRAFDLAQRQGNTAWVGSVELRLPLVRKSSVDAADHLFSAKNTYLAVFYDIGDAYVNGQSLGSVAHGVGAGLRCDVAFMSFVERFLIRFDVAQAINQNTGTQFWFGLQQPF